MKCVVLLLSSTLVRRRVEREYSTLYRLVRTIVLLFLTALSKDWMASHSYPAWLLLVLTVLAATAGTVQGRDFIRRRGSHPRYVNRPNLPHRQVEPDHVIGHLSTTTIF